MKNPSDFRCEPLSRGISGRMLLRPYMDTCKIWRVLGANPCRGTFGGRMQYAPTRVHAKFSGFHISAHEYAKNAPDFTLPNKDPPKTCPVLYPNLRRGYLRGVCNTPLHGYEQNLAGFRPKSLSQDISGRMQYAPTRVREKFGGFYTQTFGKDCFGAYAFAPYTDT